MLTYSQSITMLTRFYSTEVSRAWIIKCFSRHIGLDAATNDEIRKGCHLIVTSLSEGSYKLAVATSLKDLVRGRSYRRCMRRLGNTNRARLGHRLIQTFGKEAEDPSCPSI